MIIPSIKSSIYLLDRDIEGTYEMSVYLENNFNKSYVILANQDVTKIFTIYNNVKIDRDSYVTNSRILRDSIKYKGFAETFHQYNVRYYLSRGEGMFEDFTDLFTEDIDISSKTRKDLILDLLGQKKFYPIDIDKYFEEYRPDQYFKLEKKIGDWYLYKIE